VPAWLVKELHEMCTTRTNGAHAQTIADLLRARRLELGLSRAELARYVAASCQPSDIDVLESHRMLMPSWIRLQQLAEALEIPVTDLLPTEERALDSLDTQAAPAEPYSNP
jgi:transcriptional regulator with XRE-family HTH domain